jgi:hypothetical protein
MTEKALAIVDAVNLPALDGDLSRYAEEMEGLDMDFDRVKIPSGGALAFEVPGDDPDEPKVVQEIIGVIVDHHPVNAYWSEKFSNGSNPPDCSSMDGATGVTINGQKRDCTTCPHNQWGSAEDSRGKACKNMRRIYILPEGNLLPLLLTLPPTSLKNFSDYIVKRVIAKKRFSYSVLTKVSLRKATSSGGFTYSQATFSIAGLLNDEDTAKAAKYAHNIKAVARKLQVMADEYVPAEGTETSEEDLPF